MKGHPELRWRDDIGTRLGWADDRLWLLIEPRTVFHGITDQMNTPLQAFTDFLRYHRRHQSGPDGNNLLGSLRAKVPVARAYGFGRGMPVDRFFIERYLIANARRIRGRVLEIGDNAYTRAYAASACKAATSSTSMPPTRRPPGWVI